MREGFRRSRAALLWAGLLIGTPPVFAGELLYSTEGNRLRRFDVDTIEARPLAEDVLVASASDTETGPATGSGRDVNGMICALPDGSGGFVLGEDTGQPTPPPGWGVFDASGLQIGKLTAKYREGQAEPFGCAFDSSGRLFTSEVGAQGFGTSSGQLIVWFPDPERGFAQFPGPAGAYPNTNEPSANYCILARDLSTAGAVAIDFEDSVYVAEAGSGRVTRFLPPFPTGLGPGEGCERRDADGAPLADAVQREVFVTGRFQPPQIFTPSGLAFAPNGNLYVAGVANGEIGEFDGGSGRFLRWILRPPGSPFPLGIPVSYPLATGTPQGLAVGAGGSLYYADLNLVGVLPDLGPGPNGAVRRIRFDENGEPLPPELVRDGLAFPDGVALFPGDLERTQWRTYAGGPQRQFVNHGETRVGPDNVHRLRRRWRFDTKAIITGSPTVAAVSLPGEGIWQIAYFQSWDAGIYAVRVADGRELWRFASDPQPGATFPNSASAHVERVANRDVVLIPSGETLYALDAVTGAELWRFTAGTGCRDPLTGEPPGLCSFTGERNEIESSPIVVGGDTVVFGMDVNDVEAGRGGFYGVDLHDGRMRWFFDLESGAIENGGFVGTQVCRPFPEDEVRRFDGTHSEAELGLPAGFFATRPGCNFDRSNTGCANVWSSAAVDEARGLLFFASSNCDTATETEPALPPPPMPLFDEAIVALRFDGSPAWTWRPREVDNDDLAFGAVPNLFSIDLGSGAPVDVLGIGNKDGTYYVLDRDGVNEVNGVAWHDADASELPYWRTQVVPGGAAGGVIATAAVDEAARRVWFGTAPGGGPDGGDTTHPQQPTFHALDLDTGEVVWQNTRDPQPARASFAPTSAIPGVVFSGSVQFGRLRAYESRDDAGRLLVQLPLTLTGVASAPVVIDGTVLVGSGIGARDANPADLGDATSREPNPLSAFCALGAEGCELPDCNDGVDNDGDGSLDFLGDRGCVLDVDGSELLGDLDFDYDVDAADGALLQGALGSERGDRAYLAWGDLDANGRIDARDQTRWLAALQAYQSSTTTTTSTTTTSTTTTSTTTTTTSTTTTTTTSTTTTTQPLCGAKKCVVCHRTRGRGSHTLVVGDERSARAHLAHGDSAGACPGG
jgi:outer membrane protein assembly factor BamB